MIVFFILFIIIILAIITVLLYMRLPKFGKAPFGKRLEKLQNSPNYKNGQFQNLSHTPSLAEGNTMLGVLWDFIFTKYPNTKPIDQIPSVKTNLKDLNPNENVLIWFGHSSYFMQLDGKKYLIDPVLSGNASPVPNSNQSFFGSEIYTVEDFPKIDFLLISHDHYDHLDYKTIRDLQPKINHIYCGLGVGSHFEFWGFEKEKITEMDWGNSVNLCENINLQAVPARHFSGRTFKRNTTLWLSFVLNSNQHKIYIGGDSGYDSHFKEIGSKFGPFDWVILENGQYNEKWKYIHMSPEETIQAAIDLKAKTLLPVHNSKFKLALHPWKEPLEDISKSSTENKNFTLITPKIGEKVNLDARQDFQKWWENLN